MTYILFDIGGTTTRVAISGDLEKLDKVESFKTPIKFEEGIQKMVAVIKKLSGGNLIAIAGGIRGLLNEEKTGIQNDSVLNSWADKSIVASLQKHYNVPVFIENDSALAGVGEAVFGAGKNLDIVAYHTIGDGVGGVKIENGKIDVSSIGFEPGQQILDIDRTILGDDITPTLENLVSSTAIAERFGVPAFEMPQTDMVWDELAEYLAQGLRNTIMYWSPDVIVLGGSMIIGKPAISVDAVRKYTVESLNGFMESPYITMSELGEEAGLYGAMSILKERL
jgi:fructokinase